MNTQLNYHHLRYFLAVAAHGGIKGASETLHVSAPTLSAQVRELEDFLGVQLFKRERRKLVLNDAGRVVLRYAERIMSLGDEMVQVVQRGEPGGAEIVFLGIVDSVPKLVASRLLRRAWVELPKLRVVVREGLPAELFPALAAHQLDLVITSEPAPSSLKTLLFSKLAGRFRVHLVAAPEVRHRFSKAGGLSALPMLVPTRESALRRELDQWWVEEGIVPDIRAEFDDAAAMYELAADGVGVAPVLGPVLKDVLSRYGLVELPVRVGIQESLYVVTAERQFSHVGPRIIAQLAADMASAVSSGPAKTEKSSRPIS